MGDISNKTLAALLIIAIVISFVGLISYKPTIIGAYGEDTGTTILNITSTASIILTTSTVDFGEGYVNASLDSCTMNSTTDQKDSGCINWVPPASGFILENDGNVNVSVTINSDTAATFIGGTSPAYKFRGINSEANSCPAANLTTTYTSFTGSAQNLCTEGFRFESANDELEIKIQVTIPKDAPIDDNSANVVFVATES